MAEFDFFGTWNDTINLLKIIYETKNAKVVAKKAYRSPKEKVIDFNNKTDIELIRKNYSVIIFPELIPTQDICFSYITSRKNYVIDLFRSGPIIDVGLADKFGEEGDYRLGMGHIQIPPYFIDPKSNKQYSPPNELKNYYLLIKRKFQKILIRKFFKYEKFVNNEFQQKILPIWLGKDAMRLLKEKKAYIDWGQRHLLGSDLEN